MKQLVLPFLLSLAVLLTACEKTILKENDTDVSKQGNLTLRIFQLEQTPFLSPSRSTVEEVCTHINFAIYDMEGNRLKQTNQILGDSDFGTASFILPQGNYHLVALAHSSNGNPTMTNPEKIQFTNAKGYTDTFLYHTNLTVGDALQEMSLSLRRIVSRCSFTINDAIPEGVAQMKFVYQGGSGHFNAYTGLGVTNSKQEAVFDVEVGKQQTQYDLYTFLHETEGTLHLTVTASDANENALYERTFDIPMVQNNITWISGNFFTDYIPTSSQNTTATITINDEWGGEQHLTY